MRRAITTALAAVAATLNATAAHAQDASDTVGTAAGTIKAELLEVGAAVLPYAAMVVAVAVAWKFAARFITNGINSGRWD